MRLCKLSEIVGYEKLARSVTTQDYHELLSAGTVLKPEYVAKLMELGITEVLIDDTKLMPEEVQILREDVEDIFREKVRSVLERHVYSDNAELEELSKTADSIISSILENEEIIEQIFDIRERSADIYEHSISVCSIAILLAAKLKLSREQMHDLGVACLFHDIGLRYLDFAYTNIDIDELEEKQKGEYRKHPVYAFTSLEKEEWISKESKLMILQHHERLDGSGFPMHAKDPDITSQILEVTDAFDEMICGIGCQRTKVYEAVEYLKATKGSKFSDKLVDLILEFTAVYPAGSLVSLNTGEIAIVLKQNKQFPERPVLKVVKDNEGEDIKEDRIIDLLDVRTVYIEKVIM
ncbi:MAG: HD domain-containing protein [Lachnospiraceae bacterium]|nr:HD domain-containing protein [Lachnospiraceae bacterium]